MTDDTNKTDVDTGERPVSEVREAHDSAHHDTLKDDPSDESAIADIASDESFPASDPPSHTAFGGGEPVPSSGFNEEEERAIAEERAEANAGEQSEAEPLKYGAVSNGGAYRGGESPADAIDEGDEPREPLDAETHFGGDGAEYEAADETQRRSGSASRAVGPGDDGYDEAASKPMDTDID
jgi:hypothetical protein